MRYLAGMENLGVARETPLLSWHTQHGAKLADFGGWQMPIEYPESISTKLGKSIATGGVLAEHNAVRTNVGLFDVSHLGKIEVRGEGSLDFLNSIFTNDLNRISDGQAQYSLLCNQSGGVIDDLIVYRHSADHVFIIPNAANCATVFDVLDSDTSLSRNGLTITNAHTNFAVLAVQGPQSDAVLRQLGLNVDLEYMHFTHIVINQIGEVIICRTGYSGEFGFELLPAWENAGALWELLVDAVGSLGGQICGLGSRDTLRTEMGYPLHGHELSPEITPLEASIGWAVALSKPAVHGKEALVTQKTAGVTRLSRGLRCLERAIPRAGMSVLNSHGEVVGVTTSGTFSPTLKEGIALALISPTLGYGDHVTIDVRGRLCQAEIVKVPFVEPHVR